jgi:hypothetical protein
MLQEPATSTVQKMTPATRAALEKLADVAAPAPVSWTPQTWGWIVVGVSLLALVAWAAVRIVRRRIANRYRAEALDALAALESRFGDDGERGLALASMAPLVKRVALAAWPRGDVAALTGNSWIAFLRAHAGNHGLPDATARLLGDGEYRPSALATISAADARIVATDVRHWIEEHHVRP